MTIPLPLRRVRVVAQTFAALFLASILQAASAADYALSPDGNSVVRSTPILPISSNGFDASLITSAYAGWTVTKADPVIGSRITVDAYDAAWYELPPTRGGAKITAGYAQPNAVSAGSSLQWVQVITTNYPVVGATSPYLDPVPNDDALPFYWNSEPRDQARASPTPRSVKFDDFSKRDTSHLATTNPVNWNAQLYQAEYDGNKNVIVRNGISWGWSMKPATVGTSMGTFVAPIPACPPATCMVLDSSTIIWGTGEPGWLSFEGVAFAPTVGELFKVGTLAYHNGATDEGSEIDLVGLDIAMSFANVPELDFTHHASLSIINTPNTDDPEASADYVAFMTGDFTNSFRVYEGDWASADLMAKLTPRLGLEPATASGNDSGSDKNPGEAALPWQVIGYDIELVGFANPTAGGFISQVPEPSSWLMLTFGLAVIGLVKRNRRFIEASWRRQRGIAASALLLGAGLGMSTLAAGASPVPQIEVICFESVGSTDKPMPNFCVFSSTRVSPAVNGTVTGTRWNTVENLVVRPSVLHAVAELCMTSREPPPVNDWGSYRGRITRSSQPISTCLADPQTMRTIVDALSDDFTSRGSPLPSLLNILQRRLGMLK